MPGAPPRAEQPPPPISNVPSPSNFAPACSANSAAVRRILTSREIVNRWFAFRSRIPSPVYPDPLVRILADDMFNHLGEFLRVLHHVAFHIARSNQLDRRLEAQPVLPKALIPDGVAR